MIKWLIFSDIYFSAIWTDFSLAVLAAVSEAASFPWSACFQNGNPLLCSKSCESTLIGRTIRRELYGDNSWVYKDRFLSFHRKWPLNSRTVAHYYNLIPRSEMTSTSSRLWEQRQTQRNLIETFFILMNDLVLKMPWPLCTKPSGPCSNNFKKQHL